MIFRWGSLSFYIGSLTQYAFVHLFCFAVPITYSEISLNEFLRKNLLLSGTKVLCREGGCGICVVYVEYPDPGQPTTTVKRSINSVNWMNIIEVVCELIIRLVDQSLDCLLACLIEWLIDRSISSFIDWLIKRFIFFLFLLVLIFYLVVFYLKCLCPVLSCDGWSITTVEGTGNRNSASQIQQELTKHYGTQCGFCTPGMVMNMHG